MDTVLETLATKHSVYHIIALQFRKWHVFPANLLYLQWKVPFRS